MSKKILVSWIQMDDETLGNTLDTTSASEMRNYLRIALLEQDRDTRHKCAELVLHAEMNLGIVNVNKLHNSIMNCYEGREDVPEVVSGSYAVIVPTATNNSEKVKPIKPEDMNKHKAAALPNAVFEAFNEIIALNWNGSYATFIQKDVANLVAEKLGCIRDSVYANHYLDVEALYREAGWKVTYDKPAYNEDYEANFTFSK